MVRGRSLAFVLAVLILMVVGAALTERPTVPAGPEPHASPVSAAEDALPDRAYPPEVHRAVSGVIPGHISGQAIEDQLVAAAEALVEQEEPPELPPVEVLLDNLRQGDEAAVRSLKFVSSSCDEPDPVRFLQSLTDRLLSVAETRLRREESGTTYDEPLDLFLSGIAKKVLRQYGNCLPVWDAFDSALRQELETLAQEGNAAARYLYAVWRPGTLGLPVMPGERTAWKRKALDFSLANLEEGHRAGFAVLQEAYLQGDLFVPKKPFLGWAFQVASFQCGFDPLLGSTSTRLSQPFLHVKTGTSLEFFVTALADESESLQAYCRNPDRLSRDALETLLYEAAP